MVLVNDLCALCQKWHDLLWQSPFLQEDSGQTLSVQQSIIEIDHQTAQLATKSHTKDGLGLNLVYPTYILLVAQHTLSTIIEMRRKEDLERNGAANLSRASSLAMSLTPLASIRFGVSKERLASMWQATVLNL